MNFLLKTKNRALILLLALSISSCGIYNFTGGNQGLAKTFQVNYFQNYKHEMRIK